MLVQLVIRSSGCSTRGCRCCSTRRCGRGRCCCSTRGGRCCCGRGRCCCSIRGWSGRRVVARFPATAASTITARKPVLVGLGCVTTAAQRAVLELHFEFERLELFVAPHGVLAIRGCGRALLGPDRADPRLLVSTVRARALAPSLQLAPPFRCVPLRTRHASAFTPVAKTHLLRGAPPLRHISQQELDDGSDATTMAVHHRGSGSACTFRCRLEDAAKKTKNKKIATRVPPRAAAAPRLAENGAVQYLRVPPRAAAAPRLAENGAVQYLRHMSPLKHLKDSSVAHANCGERMAYGLTETTTTKRLFSLV